MMYQALHSVYGQIPPGAHAGSSSATFGFPVPTGRQEDCSPSVSAKVLVLKGTCLQMLCVVVVHPACPQAEPSAAAFQGKGCQWGHAGHCRTYFTSLPNPLNIRLRISTGKWSPT